LWRPILGQPNARICSLAGDESGYKRSLGTYTPEIALQTVEVAQIGAVVVHVVQTAPLRAVTLDFDYLVPGKGWSFEATYPHGVTFQWMDSTVATILLPLATDRDMHIEFRVLYTMSPDILQSLTLRVNGQPIQLSAIRDPGGAALIQGIIPRSTLESNSRHTLLTFGVNHTLIPEFVLANSDDPRTLALAFDWLHIETQP
jgi:hypothetical protein